MVPVMVPGSNLVHFPDWTLGSNLAVIHTDVHVYYYITGSPCQVTSHLALFSWLSPGGLCDRTGFNLLRCYGQLLSRNPLVGCFTLLLLLL